MLSYFIQITVSFPPSVAHPNYTYLYTTYVNCVVRTRFNARVTFPTHAWFDVVSTTETFKLLPRQTTWWNLRSSYRLQDHQEFQLQAFRYPQLHLKSGHHLMQCNAMQCNAVQWNAIQCNAMQCNAMECDAMQCNTMRCNAMQCNPMQDKARQGKARQGKAKTCNPYDAKVQK